MAQKKPAQKKPAQKQPTSKKSVQDTRSPNKLEQVKADAKGTLTMELLEGEGRNRGRVHGLEYFEVVGKGAAYVLDAGEMTHTNLVEGETETTLSSFNIKLHLLGRGFRFDLKNRLPVLPVETRKEKKKSA